MKNNNFKIKEYKKGAALVEFAIMVTVLVPLLLYISFFTELIQFRMKIDEMKYFAAWELTAHNLSDYSSTEDRGAFTNAGTKFNSIKAKIQAKTQELYSNLDSADPNRTVGYIMISPDPNSYTLTLNSVTRDTNGDDENNTEPQGADSGGGGIINQVLGYIEDLISSGVEYVAGKAFGFNTNYIGIKAKASGSFSITKKMNTKIMTKDTGGFTNKELLQEDLASGNLATYESPEFTVWTDTWALSDGKDVINVNGEQCISKSGKFGTCHMDTPYARQVQRMSLLGSGNALGGRWVRGALNILGSGFLQYLSFLDGMFGADEFERPSEARMVSINYYYNNDDQHGNYTNNISKGQNQFQTSPLTYIFRGNINAGTDEGITEYRATLQKRRNFYMGNNEPNCNYQGLSEDCAPMP